MRLVLNPFTGKLDYVVTSGDIDHGELLGLNDDDHTQYVLINGTRALTGNWDAGSFNIQAETFTSDVVTGTAPLTIASTTLVSNLNADLLDGQEGSYYLDLTNATTQSAIDHGSISGLGDDDHTQYVLRQPTADTVINDAGSDYDFRIEGNNNPNLFYVDAGTDSVGIGTTPTSLLHTSESVSSLPAASHYGVQHSSFVSLETDFNNLLYGVNNQVTTAGSADYTVQVRCGANIYYHSGTGTVSTAHAFFNVGGLLGNGVITTLNLITAQTFSNAGTGTIGTVNGLNIADLGTYNTPTSMRGIFIGGNTNAVGTSKYGIFIQEISGASSVNYALYCDGGDYFLDKGSLIFNQGGGDYDFRFEGDGDQNLLFGDAGNDRIGIGTNTPTGKLSVVHSGTTSQFVGTHTFATSGSTTTNSFLSNVYVTGGTTGEVRAGYYLARCNDTSNGTLAGVSALVGAVYLGLDAASDNIITLARGVSGNIINATSNSGGIIVTAQGLRGSVVNSGSGIIRNAYGCIIDAVQATGTDAGQTHNAFGIYVSNSISSSGGATNNSWSIYSASTADSYLAGSLGIGISTPASKLDVVGDSRFGNSSTNYTAIDSDGDITFNGTARIDWTKITASSVTITVGGTDASSVVANLQTENDGNIFHLDETAASPAIDFYVEFTSVTAFNWVKIRGNYVGSDTHAMGILLYDWVAGAWKHKNCFQSMVYDTTAQQEVICNQSFFVESDTNFIGTGANAGKVRVRFVHPMLGNASHDLYIDVVALYQ